jgi:hypothetical protein
MADERNWKHFAKMSNEAQKPALQQADVMRWVAVAESLPTEDKLYLTYDGTFQVFRYWKGNHFEGEHVATEPKVTYWMEVPEPPFA